MVLCFLILECFYLFLQHVKNANFKSTAIMLIIKILFYSFQEIMFRMASQFTWTNTITVCYMYKWPAKSVSVGP